MVKSIHHTPPRPTSDMRNALVMLPRKLTKTEKFFDFLISFALVACVSLTVLVMIPVLYAKFAG